MEREAWEEDDHWWEDPKTPFLGSHTIHSQKYSEGPIDIVLEPWYFMKSVDARGKLSSSWGRPLFKNPHENFSVILSMRPAWLKVDAFAALQVAAKYYLVGLLDNANICVIHAKCVCHVTLN